MFAAVQPKTTETVCVISALNPKPGPNLDSQKASIFLYKKTMKSFWKFNLLFKRLHFEPLDSNTFVSKLT